jgi:hypothetical protein
MTETPSEPYDQDTLADLAPITSAYRAGELTAAGVVKLVRPVAARRGLDADHLASWVIVHHEPLASPPGDAQTDVAALALPRDPREVPKTWLAVAAVVVAVGVSGGAGIVALAHSAGSGDTTVSGHLTLVPGDGGLYSDPNYNSSGRQCEGSGGYSDISEGASVTVTDATGKVVATGSLGVGRKDVLGCVFPFSVTGVPKSKFYGVEVSHRGIVTFRQLDAGTAEVSLGS